MYSTTNTQASPLNPRGTSIGYGTDATTATTTTQGPVVRNTTNTTESDQSFHQNQLHSSIHASEDRPRCLSRYERHSGDPCPKWPSSTNTPTRHHGSPIRIKRCHRKQDPVKYTDLCSTTATTRPGTNKRWPHRNTRQPHRQQHPGTVWRCEQ